jgi:hypothetical protein
MMLKGYQPKMMEIDQMIIIRDVQTMHLCKAEVSLVIIKPK